MPDNKTTKLLCIFTKVLGGKTFSEVLELLLSRISFLECLVISYEGSDYLKYPTPMLLRYSNTLDSAWRINLKVKCELGDWHYDRLFFSSYHLLLPFWFAIKYKKTYLALDTTPSLALTQQSRLGSTWEKNLAILKGKISKIIFKKLFRHVDVFFARTQWCADSLIDDYCVRADHVVVTYMPVDVPNGSVEALAGYSKGKLSLLFVGNDFERKGGRFLLDLFAEYLSEQCRLIILSSAAASNYDLPTGVTWVSGCDRDTRPSIFDYYQHADLFIFPTWYEQLGLVLCEAISVGLPVIARDVGGIRELVEDGGNGYLQGLDSSMKSWGNKILHLAENRQLLATFSDRSLAIAHTVLDYDDFEQAIRQQLA